LKKLVALNKERASLVMVVVRQQKRGVLRWVQKQAGSARGKESGLNSGRQKQRKKQIRRSNYSPCSELDCHTGLTEIHVKVHLM
jgi:hypothetical protein